MKVCFIVVMGVFLVSCAATKKTVTEYSNAQPAVKVVKPDPVFMVLPEGNPQKSGTATVFFEFDSYSVSNFTSSDLMEKLSGIKNILCVVGYCCPVGTEEYNLVLGEKRAIAVKNILEQNGYTVGAIKSMGECNPVSLNPDKYHLNRRCVVVY